MKINIKVSGTANCIKRIENITNMIYSNELKEYIAKKAIEIINKDAKEKLQQNDTYINSNKYKMLNNGVLIYNDVQNDKGEYYSLILEYGSGIYAEKEHIGNSQSFKNSGGLYWLVPVEEGSSLFNTDFEIITLDSGDYFKVFGQTAKHIYEDSAKQIEKRLGDWIKEYFKKYIGGK